MGLYSFLKQKLKVEEQIDEGESMDVGRIYSEVPVEKGEHSKPKEEKKKQEEVRQYVYPELGLLENTSKNLIEEKDVRERSLLLKRALNAIGIDITIVDIHISSRFVIYEIELAAGISVKQLKNAYNDKKEYIRKTLRVLWKHAIILPKHIFFSSLTGCKMPYVLIISHIRKFMLYFTTYNRAGVFNGLRSD